MKISEWVERQQDREANGDNWWRWFGSDRLELGHSFLLTEWGLGLDAAVVDDNQTFGVKIGPLWVGILRWTGWKKWE